MYLAVRTTASPAAIWAIVIVAVVLLAFWLIMVMVYAARPDPRLRRLAGAAGPALGGIDMAGGRSVAPAADAPAEAGAGIPAQRGPQVPTEPADPIPAQRAAPADTPATAGTSAGDTTPTDTAGPGAGGNP